MDRRHHIWLLKPKQFEKTDLDHLTEYVQENGQIKMIQQTSPN